MLITNLYCRSSNYEAEGTTEHWMQLQLLWLFMCIVAILGCCTPHICLSLTKSNLLLVCRTLTLGCNLFCTMLPSVGISWSLWLPICLSRC